VQCPRFNGLSNGRVVATAGALTGTGPDGAFQWPLKRPSSCNTSMAGIRESKYTSFNGLSNGRVVATRTTQTWRAQELGFQWPLKRPSSCNGVYTILYAGQRTFQWPLKRPSSCNSQLAELDMAAREFQWPLKRPSSCNAMMICPPVTAALCFNGLSNGRVVATLSLYGTAIPD
jgi:hypothetical protein